MPVEPGQIINPEGKNGKNGKPFRDALRMEIAAAGEDHKALRRIARNLIELASIQELGALPSIKEVADRVDGRVPQPVGGTDELPPQVHEHRIVERLIVDPIHTDSTSIQAPPGTEPV